jgi:hypothetical protein
MTGGSPEDVTIVFTTRDWLFARLIRKITKSPTSHVAMGGMIHGVPILVHADYGGVQVSPLTKYLRQNRVVAIYRPKGVDLVPSICSAVQAIGQGYDYVGLFGYAWVMVARRFGRKVKNPLASAAGTVCSELVTRVCQAMVPGWRDIEPEETTPEDLLELVAASKYFEKV